MVAVQEQNPYHRPDTKDKLKVISEKLKDKMTSKLDGLFSGKW